MKDMMDLLYQEMKINEVLERECADRIKGYIYPETADTSRPFITIRPLQPPQASNYGSDQNLGYQFFYQIDVQSKNRMKCKEIQAAVKEVMEGLGFSQQTGGLDEYFEETKRYVDARRYSKTTQLYDTDY